MLSGPISTTLSAATTGAAILKQLNEVAERLKPFKPEVRSFRIDHLERSSEVKYLLWIPNGIRRTLRRRIDIPAIAGFRFDEMWDADRFELVNFCWGFQDNAWVLDLGKLPSSERYWLTMKGRLSNDFLDKLVSVRAAENPSKEGNLDKYWVHSALKDVSILQKIWNELNIEQVNADVRIGVERIFTSTIPKEIQERLQLQSRLLDAIATGNRNLEQTLKYRYRKMQMTPVVSPSELYELLLNLVSGDFFSSFVKVDHPFVLGNIEPIKRLTNLVPEKVKVGVQTDLSFNMPVAKGNLCFQRQQYLDSVTNRIKDLLPKKKRR